MADDLLKGMARLMVKRHLSDLIRPEIGTEDQLVEMFIRCARATPDARMGDLATAFRMTVNRKLLERACRVPSYRTLETPAE